MNGLRGRDWAHYLAMWALLCVMLALASLHRIVEWQFPDPDDVLRLVQVRDLLAGQGWFDLTQHRIDPLRSVPMHWSRLVDLPLAIVIGALTPMIGQGAAEAVAVVAIPLLALLVTVLFLGDLAARAFGRRIGGYAVLCAGLMPMLIHQYQPLRIDHHGWQITCFAAAAWGILHPRVHRGAAVAGLAMAAGLLISIEMLPLAAIAGAVLALRWLRARDGGAGLATFLQVLALSLVGLFLATRGMGDLAPYCDAIAPAHLAFFTLAALGVSVLRLAPSLPPAALAASLGGIGAIGVAMFGAMAPQCLATPFGSLDPLVHDVWYQAVSEGLPIWHQKPVFVPVVVQLAIALAIMALLWRHAAPEAAAWWFDLLLLFAGSLALGVLVTRSLAFASALAAIPMAWLLDCALQRLRAHAGFASKAALAMGTACIILPSAPVALAQQLMPASSTAEAENAAEPGNSFCTSRAAGELLARLPTGTIFAPVDIGPSFLLQTDHGVIATGHHRNQLAMRDVIGAFVAPPEVSQLIVESYGADYLVLCTGIVEPQMYAQHGGERSLAARLLADDAPDWLEPVELGGSDTFRVWRVRD